MPVRLQGVIGKATWWEGHVFGDLGNGFKEGMDMWGQLPNGKMHYCNDTLNAYNLNPIKPHSMILLGIMEGKPASFDASMPDFLSFAKCYTSSFAMGDIGGGITICFQVYDSGADFVRGCDAFTPWFQSGANPALIEFFTTAPITSYAVGGLSPAAKKALAPYGDLPNFDQVYPKLIGAHGGDGAGGSHVVHYFRNAADAAAGKRAYNKVFQQARDGGANIGGTCTDYRQCTSAISIIVNYDTVPDWAAAHEKAYADEDFQKVAASWIHAQVEIYGSMTYELASTFPGWESLGSVCFRKDTPILYTSIHGVEQSDDPVEIMQHIDLCGDGKAYLDFFLDPRIAKLTYEHKATFVITQYGPEKAKGYFRFKNSQSFADYWTAAGVEAGDKLTAIVEAGTCCSLLYMRAMPRSTHRHSFLLSHDHACHTTMHTGAMATHRLLFFCWRSNLVVWRASTRSCRQSH